MFQLPPFILFSSAFVLLPFILSVGLKYDKTDAFHRRLRNLLGVMVFVEASGAVLRYLGVENNMPLYHAYVIVEYALTVWLFESVSPKIIDRAQVFILWGVMFVLVVVTHWEVGGIYEFPTIMRTGESLILIFLSVRFFWVLMNDSEGRNLWALSGFWLSVGVLIYFSANLLLFAYGNFMVSQSNAVFNALWHLHAALNVLLYFVYTIAVLCPKPIEK